jgi:glyceraldehyde 3-phosphate dehydrogenase
MPDVYNIVHLNDIAAPESIAYLIKYDSIHGTWEPTVKYSDGFITITSGDRSVHVPCTRTADPSQV